MVVMECLKAYTQLITTIITDINYNLFKNQFRLTPSNVGS